MRMSGFCRKHKRSLNLWAPFTARQSGFTLLEVLIVLVMVGLLAGLALPQFNIIRERLEFTLNRDSFEQELSGLGYRAFKEGQSLMLSGEYPRKPNDTQGAASASIDDVESEAVLDPSRPAGQYRQKLSAVSADATLTLPDQWHVKVDAPIVYQPSGFCAGGSVTLAIGNLKYVYALKAPECLAELAK